MSKTQVTVSPSPMAAIVLGYLLGLTTLGTPDIIDGIIYKLTDVKVWNCEDNQCFVEPKNDQ